MAEFEKASFPDRAKLQEHVDEHIARFERREEAVAKELEARGSKPDKDGFVLVTRKKKDLGLEDESLLSAAQRRKRKRGSLEATDFYRFQKRDEKLARLQELQSRFEDDKARLRKMREARLFKPY